MNLCSANSGPVGEEILHPLQNREVRYHIHKTILQASRIQSTPLMTISNIPTYTSK